MEDTEFIYTMTRKDSFNNNIFFHNNQIISVQDYKEKKPNGEYDRKMLMDIFDCTTITITEKEELQYVSFEKIKKISHHIINYNNMFLIDSENKMFTKTSDFPYPITEIDGNYITSCRFNNNKFLHSRKRSRTFSTRSFDCSIDV